MRRQDKADRVGEIVELICEIGLAPTTARKLRRVAEHIIEGRDVGADDLLSLASADPEVGSYRLAPVWPASRLRARGGCCVGWAR